MGLWSGNRRALLQSTIRVLVTQEGVRRWAVFVDHEVAVSRNGWRRLNGHDAVTTFGAPARILLRDGLRWLSVTRREAVELPPRANA